MSFSFTSPQKRQLFTEWFCVFVLSISYFFVIGFAMSKSLWYDELFTWNIARLSPARIWQSLGQGVDLNPPLIYYATKVSSSFFGDGNWGTRLPSASALWITGLAIYGFVRRRASAWTALGAALLPLAGGIYIWGVEARPYALMVASCALAFFFWQKSVETSSVETSSVETLNAETSNIEYSNDAAKRNSGFWWPVLLALALAMGISSHYYAIFIWVPLFIGEVVRSFERRKIAWPIWAAFVVGLLPLFFYLPLIESSRPYMSTFWSKSVPREDIVQFYRAFLKPAMLPFAITMGVLAFRTALVARNRKRDGSQNPRSPLRITTSDVQNNESSRIPRYEMAACVALAFVPVMATFFALFTQRGYTLRYAAIGTVGCYLVLSLLVSLGEKKWKNLGKVFAIAVVFGFFMTQVDYLQGMRAVSAQGLAPFPLLSRAANIEKNLPLVIDSPVRFMAAWHHGSPPLRKRLRYLTDTALSTRFVGNDTNDRAMATLRHWAPIRVTDFSEFKRQRRAFLLYDSGEGMRWLKPKELRSLGAKTSLLTRRGNEALYIVSWSIQKTTMQKTTAQKLPARNVKKSLP